MDAANTLIRQRESRRRRGRGRPGSLDARLSAHPAAVTLIEMLIVLFIISLLAVAALRALPGEDQRVREAARMIDTYLGAARNRAMELGRPVGVSFERNPIRPEACTILQQCEVPPPYAGDTTDAVVKISLSPYGYLLKIRANDLADNTLRSGDMIRFNNQGPYYRINYLDDKAGPLVNGYIQFTPYWTDADNDGWFDSPVQESSGIPLFTISTGADMPMQQTPWQNNIYPNYSSPITFSIVRQPVKSTAQPLQLPAGTAVDLGFSSIGRYQYFARNARLRHDDLSDTKSPVMLMFSPNGSVERVYRYHGTIYTYRGDIANGPIYLLVGRYDRVLRFVLDPSTNDPPIDHFEALPETPIEDQYPNWTDPTSQWIVVQPQTGYISTAEMYPVDRAGVDWTRTDPAKWDPTKTPYPPGWPYVPLPLWPEPSPKDDHRDWITGIEQSRTFAREAQAQGER